MQFLDLTLRTLAENLALDEALLLEAEAGRSGELLRLWEWREYAVVLGAGCRLADEVDEDACLADGVPIARRASGGGTVLLGPGCLCYSLVLSYERSAALREVRPSFAWILEQIREALLDIDPRIDRAGISDLAIAARKFSGNAQQRKRNHLLHHGTILYGFDIERIDRYVRMPARQPEYRGSREHATFLVNLPADPGQIDTSLRNAWHASPASLTPPEDNVRKLTITKYANREWIHRR